jgi:hypothetical protein
MREGAGKASCVPVARRGKDRWTMTKAVDASKILDEIWRFRDDPLGFVHFAFPWGEENGPLANHPGPDDWQTDVLRELGRGARHPNKPCRVAIASGHGIGKGALTAWTILWFMSTRENPQIVVTANTSTQLSTKTWRELAKWHKMALNESWFVHTATRFYHKERPDLWYAAAIPWSDEHSEAFAGTHEQDVLMIFDEACHDDQTDVLTSEGWKRFANLTGKEKLLTMDPETGIAEYLAPVRLHRNHFEGELFTYDRRGGSFPSPPTTACFTGFNGIKEGSAITLPGNSPRSKTSTGIIFRFPGRSTSSIRRKPFSRFQPSPARGNHGRRKKSPWMPGWSCAGGISARDASCGMERNAPWGFPSPRKIPPCWRRSKES